MNVEVEFFNIVNEIGPLGDIDLDSYESHPATSSYKMSSGCGCGTSGEDTCCSTDTVAGRASAPGLDESNPAALNAPNGPDDRRVTLYPKWDPGTRAWWLWDDTEGCWLKTA